MEITNIDLAEFFKKSDLIPAIVQEACSGEVLMLAYMNRESLELTLRDRTCWYFSRSRGKLWHKGETSGHFQHVKEILFDCDEDTLLVKVDQEGAACHTGSHSCFYRKLK